MKTELSDGEWTLMTRLWEHPGSTITELTAAMRDETGWSKHTIISMLSRMEAKGAIAYEQSGRAKAWYPLLRRSDAARKETRRFLLGVPFLRPFSNAVSLSLGAAGYEPFRAGGGCSGTDIENRNYLGKSRRHQRFQNVPDGTGHGRREHFPRQGTERRPPLPGVFLGRRHHRYAGRFRVQLAPPFRERYRRRGLERRAPGREVRDRHHGGRDGERPAEFGGRAGGVATTFSFAHQRTAELNVPAF